MRVYMSGQEAWQRLAWPSPRPRSECRGPHLPLPTWSTGYTRV
jgi:hypothetical protein